MRTVRCSSRLLGKGGCCLPRKGVSACQGGVCLPGGMFACQGVVCPEGVCLLGGLCLPGWVYTSLCGQTDTRENITFPQLLLRTVIKKTEPEASKMLLCRSATDPGIYYQFSKLGALRKILDLYLAGGKFSDLDFGSGNPPSRELNFSWKVLTSDLRATRKLNFSWRTWDLRTWPQTKLELLM